jgi:hypothetical protein
LSIFFKNVELLAPPLPQPKRWRFTSCRPSAATYFIHWQLYCICRGRLLHLQLSDTPYGGSSYPLTMACWKSANMITRFIILSCMLTVTLKARLRIKVIQRFQLFSSSKR